MGDKVGHEASVAASSGAQGEERHRGGGAAAHPGHNPLQNIRRRVGKCAGNTLQQRFHSTVRAVWCSMRGYGMIRCGTIQ